MTKEQYIHSECASCYSYNHCGWRNRGETCNTIRYASRAWDKAVEATAEAATNWINKHLAEWSIVESEDLKDFCDTLKRDLK